MRNNRDSKKAAGSLLVGGLLGLSSISSIASVDAASQMVATQSLLGAFFDYIPSFFILLTPIVVGIVFVRRSIKMVDKGLGLKGETNRQTKLIQQLQEELSNDKQERLLEIENMKLRNSRSIPFMNQADGLPNTIDIDSGKYDFLKDHKATREAYIRVNKQAEVLQRSLLGERDKERAVELNKLAGKVVFSLKNLNDIGSLNIDLAGNTYNADNPSPAMKAQGKMQEILGQMDALTYKQADRIGSSIDDLLMPASYELEDEFEKLKIDGSALLSIIKYKDTAVSKESEFVLRKVVETRLDEMWEEYSRGKNAFTSKALSSEISLSKPSDTQTPDDIIKEVFVLVRGMYADIEKSIRTSKEDTAIRDLLATKDYFVQRGKS